MLAKDIMTKDVAFVTGDAQVRDVARLLIKKSISAVPVLDENLRPIGMVSEGDLASAAELHRNARAQWWLAQLAEGEPLNQKFLATILRDGRRVCDIMTSPVISVEDTAEVEEIARLIGKHRIKRVVVVNSGKAVGIVSRADIVRAVAAEMNVARLAASLSERGKVFAIDLPDDHRSTKSLSPKR
jgi:CBS domain-containing protein